jgi:hypothetical protein
MKDIDKIAVLIRDRQGEALRMAASACIMSDEGGI